MFIFIAHTLWLFGAVVLFFKVSTFVSVFCFFFGRYFPELPPRGICFTCMSLYEKGKADQLLSIMVCFANARVLCAPPQH